MGIKFNIFTGTFDLVDQGGTLLLAPVANRAALPSGDPDGALRVVLDEDSLFEYDNGTDTWHNLRLSPTEFSAVANAAGITIVVDNTIGTPNISDYKATLHAADASNPGGVSTVAQTFAGDKTFSNNVIITGNLTVNGTQTILNTATVDSEDPNVTLNKGGNDASSEGAGITVERTGTDGSIVYEDALTAKFKAGALGSEIELANISSSQILQNKTMDFTSATGNNTISADASDIDYDNSSSGLVATETQSAIDEVEGRVDTAETDISNHISDTVDAHDASAISYDNSSSGLTAIEAQAAIDEIENRLDTAETNITNKADTDLNNIASVSFSDHLIPQGTQTLDLGSNVNTIRNVKAVDHEIWDAGNRYGTLRGSITNTAPGYGFGSGLRGEDRDLMIAHSQTGYNIIIQTRSASGGTPSTGNIDISSGSTTGTGNSGNVIFQVGSSTGGTQGVFKLLKIGDTVTPTHVWTASAADGTGYWAAPPTTDISGKADTDLNNLAGTTSVNSTLIPAGTTQDIGGGTAPWRNIRGQELVSMTTGGQRKIRLRHGTLSMPSGASVNTLIDTEQSADGLGIKTGGIGQGLFLETGNIASNGSGPQIKIKTGDRTNNTSGATGDLNFLTGDQLDGGSADDSGNILIATGSVAGSGTRGIITLDASDVNIPGKLTVGGGIDPEYLQLDPQAGDAGIPNNSIFVDSNDSNKFKFKDNGGTSAVIGGISGPVSSTDNALVRFDGTTGEIVQDSNITVDDSGNIESLGSNFENSKSLLFDGTTAEYVRIPYNAGLNSTAALTASCWVKRSANPGDNKTFFAHAPLSGDFRWIMSSGLAGANNNKLRVVITGSGTFGSVRKAYNSSADICDGNWHHVAFTYAGGGSGTLKLYVDGVLSSGTIELNDSVSALHSVVTNQDASIGAYTIDSTPFQSWDSNVDECSIFDLTLSDSEIAEIYNSGVPKDLSQHSQSGNLQGWWQCGDNATFPTIPDRTGTSDATMTGMEVGDIVSDVASVVSNTELIISTENQTGFSDSKDINIKTGTTVSGSRGTIKLSALAIEAPVQTADPAITIGGAVYYNSVTGKLRVYNDVAIAWQDLN